MSESHHHQQQQYPPYPLEDLLFCQEDNFEEEELTNASSFELNYSFNGYNIDPSSPPCSLAEHDLFCDEDELSTLLSKEEANHLHQIIHTDPCVKIARNEAVDWILRVHSNYALSLLTALMAVNYLDRFLFGFKLHKDKPWLTQLVALACLSIAAKVEETHVPLLLDLQAGDSKYVFEAKTVQRMEMLVLSTLEWKMNPVTPYSFVDYMIRRLELKGHICWEFLRRCEMVLLASVSDLRFVGYLPSVVAAATMLHIINSVEPSFEEEYQNLILGVLGISKEKVEECEELIVDLALEVNISHQTNKRKSVCMPGSPNGVIDVSFSSDYSNDSWAVASSWLASSSACSSPEPLAKKMRADQGRHSGRLSHSSADSFSILR